MIKAKYVPDVPREQIIDALERFDIELRESPKWKSWEDKRNHKYAIKYEDRLYPEKEIIILATGASRNSFAGGPEAISYLEDRGFTVVPLRPDKVFEFSEDDFSEKVDGTTWRGQLSKILRQDLSEITGEVIIGRYCRRSGCLDSVPRNRVPVLRGRSWPRQLSRWY
ncbi:MAG: NAD(P)/FAD-dependent oxidoreductase [Actinobacteria bacterium]|nr:NAD(P)/FAD-dependent oxidoreductase [Actinomycetota bacterium]MCG2818047.1 NAD(P)/FAD-dependent oxidoreductase [Actinomycetes bacterium]MBU4217357.1 NAD(P)/FAD-dependent oxidoreductase [Actinomycetota bacterium]MBU4359635.1 NAD(P)/FAD-dependent oxidoreductase [Actinomycetota bacterium]MBU4392198.1 NAD(P)/FAD-dependent oxidoreductase [Actinomycetota bacterium]